MNNPSDLLLYVWREACRHVHIEESVSSIGDVLLQRMSLDGLIIRTIDFEKSRIKTVASAFRNKTDESIEVSASFNQQHSGKIMEWLHSSEIIHIKPDTQHSIIHRTLFPEWLDGGAMAGPLLTENSPHGIIIIYTENNRRLLLDHKIILKDLLEPFRIALNNDQRLEEMKILKEAAEADKESLLFRLGRAEIGDMVIGANKGLKTVMERVKLVANSDLPVLILGETGSGKEVVAREIHQQSPRHRGPFIRVNCGAIPSELIDSELFGHQKGSFTGAIETRLGWFERADGGTLFLDEVGELPLAAQVRLLRVLQDGTFERVGGGKPIHVDVRIVAATHKDLPGMVSQSKFREDLWYRLAVFPIYLPPIRDRKEDIPDLARHFTVKASQRFGVPQKALGDEGLSRLLNYEWPGNVRELATVIERATILSKGIELDIDTALGIQPRTNSSSTSSTLNFEKRDLDSFPTLDKAMKKHIEEALKLCKGRVEGVFGAAEILDINPHTLRGRMRKLGIDWKEFRPY